MSSSNWGYDKTPKTKTQKLKIEMDNIQKELRVDLTHTQKKDNYVKNEDHITRCTRNNGF